MRHNHLPAYHAVLPELAVSSFYLDVFAAVADSAATNIFLLVLTIVGGLAVAGDATGAQVVSAVFVSIGGGAAKFAGGCVVTAGGHGQPSHST